MRVTFENRYNDIYTESIESKTLFFTFDAIFEMVRE